MPHLPISRRPGRAVVLQPTWVFWQHAMPPGHLAARRAEQAGLVARLDALSEGTGGPTVQFVDAGHWDAEGGTAEVSELDDADAVVLLVTMAFTPGVLDQLLAAHPDLPVVICAYDDGTPIDSHYGHESIAARGATVGTPMIGSAFTKRGRHWELVLVSPEDEGSLRRLVDVSLAACAAGKLRRSVIGRLGGVQGGYTHVDVSPETVASSFGAVLRDLGPEVFAASFRDASAAEVDERAAGWADRFGLEGWKDDEGYLATSRAAVGLESVVADQRLDAGVMNCHVAQIRFNPELGIAPCFALGCSTSAGAPWTCTGDTLTAVAMLLGQLLSHSSLYHELEVLDRSTGQLVIGNTGEHDEAWFRQNEQALQRNVWFEDVDVRSGFVARSSLDPGPATLLAVVPDGSSLKVVSAEGQVTDSSYPRIGTVNGAFRFSLEPAALAWTTWARFGVTHHSALARGHLSEAVETVCSYQGVRHQTVA